LAWLHQVGFRKRFLPLHIHAVGTQPGKYRSVPFRQAPASVFARLLYCNHRIDALLLIANAASDEAKTRPKMRLLRVIHSLTGHSFALFRVAKRTRMLKQSVSFRISSH
jgi:hypothetical protein